MNTRTKRLPHCGRRKSRNSGVARRCGVLLAGLVLAASCTKAPAGGPEEASGRVPLNFTAGIATESLPQTKAAPIEGTVFPPRNEDYPIGMWVCRHEDAPLTFVPAMSGYGNLLAALGVTAKDEGGVNEYIWSYTFDGKTHSILSVPRHRPVDIYAYYPHTEETAAAADPRAIPFRTGEQTDWLWAEPRTLDASMLEGGQVDVPLRFEHAMTCLQVEIKCLYSGSVRLTSMTLTDSEGRLYPSGVMDIVNRKLVLDDSERTGQITIAPNAAVGTSATKFCILMPPPIKEGDADYGNGEFTLSFVFNGIDAETTFPIPNRMTTAGGEVVIKRFETGTRYIYRLTLDNTMEFVPVGVDKTWTNEEIDLEL